jgi:hypothetical protein
MDLRRGDYENVRCHHYTHHNNLDSNLRKFCGGLDGEKYGENKNKYQKISCIRELLY